MQRPFNVADMIAQIKKNSGGGEIVNGHKISIPSMNLRIEIKNDDTGETIGIMGTSVEIEQKAGSFPSINEKSGENIVNFVSKVVTDKLKHIESVVRLMYDMYISDKKENIAKKESNDAKTEPQINEEARSIILDGDGDGNETPAQKTESFSERIDRLIDENNKKTYEKNRKDEIPF